MNKFLFKKQNSDKRFFLKIKITLLVLFFITPVLSYATQEKQGLFFEITNLIDRMIRSESPEVHKDLKKANDSEKLQQVNNLNTQNVNNDITNTTNTGPAKQNYPFFWQIERDGKKSYILGTIHKGVSFKRLPYHEDIKSYLRSADFLLSENPKSTGSENSMDAKEGFLEFISEAAKAKIELLSHQQKLSQALNNGQSSSFSQEEIDFLTNLWNESYFNQHGYYPSYEESKDKVMSLDFSELKQLIESSLATKIKKEVTGNIENISRTVWYSIIDIKNKILYNKKISLDDQIEDYFLEHNSTEFVSSLDDLKIQYLLSSENSSTTIEEIKEMIKKYPKNKLSKEEINELIAGMSRYLKELHRRYLSGDMNIKNLDRDLYIPIVDIIDKIIRRSYLKLDFRNQLWLPKIIKAFEQHNSIFIVAGIDHFLIDEHNPFNIPELEEYARQNKNLPRNIIDMLKNEGFKVTRFGEGDFIPANPCQRAFL